jgi:Extracellular link domain
MWFLAIYIVVYFIMSMFRNPDPHTNRMVTVSRTFDFIILLLLVVSLIMTFYTKSDEEKGQLVEDTYMGVTDFVDSTSSIFTLVIFIVVFYFAIYLVGIPMDYDTKPSTVSMVETGSWILLVLAMIFLFFKTVLGISVKDYLDEFFMGIWYPESEKSSATAPAPAPEPEKPKEEVFNIGDNAYTYEDAQTICSAYGSRLATYDDIEKAYNDGGEWCNYGWSEGQMIYFPTQKKTWDALQKTEKHKNSCGRPGINGGFIDNPYARFGVNCYGVKPKPTDEDLEKLKSTAGKPDSVIPKTEEDEVLALKIKYWKENGNKILKINSFNNDKWSAL